MSTIQGGRQVLRRSAEEYKKESHVLQRVSVINNHLSGQFPSSQHIIHSLLNDLAKENVISDAQKKAMYEKGWRYGQGPAVAIVKPETAEQIQTIIAYCKKHGVAIVPQAGNSSLSGASVPPSEKEQDGRPFIIVTTKNLNKIEKMDDATITVGAGVALTDIYKHLESTDKAFPLKLAAPSATAGGICATTAGGVETPRYGGAEFLCAEMHWIDPGGKMHITKFQERPAVSNAQSAYGKITNESVLKRSEGFNPENPTPLGAEGTMGIITKVVLRIFPQNKTKTICMAFASPADAVRFKQELYNDGNGVVPERYEYLHKDALDFVKRQLPNEKTFDTEINTSNEHFILCEVPEEGMEHFNSVLKKTRGVDGFTCANDEIATQAWKTREFVSRSVKNYAEKHQLKTIAHDICLKFGDTEPFPRPETVTKIAELGVVEFAASFGHFFENAYHYNLLIGAATPDDIKDKITRLVFADIKSRGGCISAEHGIGAVRENYIEEYGNKELRDQQREIKKQFDPENIFNPNRVVGLGHCCSYAGHQHEVGQAVARSML